MANLFLPQLITWFRLDEHVKRLKGRVDELEANPSNPDLQQVTIQGNTTDQNIISSDTVAERFIEARITNVNSSAGLYASGLLKLRNLLGFTTDLGTTNITADRTIELPDESGVVALQVTETPYRVIGNFMNPTKFAELSTNNLTIWDAPGNPGIFVGPTQIEFASSGSISSIIAPPASPVSGNLSTLTGVTGTIPSLNTNAPATASTAGTVGEIRVTPTFIYTCVAPNTWVRAAMATW